MQTLVTLGSFEAKARALLDDKGFEELLEFLARRPKVGRIIQGTGGLRKVRIASSGRGKRGGARIIYYYHDEYRPILLFLIYARANQENMTNAQKAEYRTLLSQIIDEFG